MMKKCILCVLAVLCISGVYGKITYIDANVTNTTLNGNALVEGINYIQHSTTDPANGLWGLRLRPNCNGGSVWETDTSASGEITEPLVTTITIPNPGTYKIYGLFCISNQGTSRWDCSFSLGSDGPYKLFDKTNAALAKTSDFEGTVLVADTGGTSYFFLAEIAVITTTTADEPVSVYIQGEDVYSGDDRTWYEGLGYQVVTEAHSPNPVNKEGLYTEDIQLSWYAGFDPNDPTQMNPAIVSYNLYVDILNIDSTAEPNLVDPYANIPAGTNPMLYPSSGALTIGYGKRVYWRVNEVLTDSSVIEGPVWSFTTLDPALVKNLLAHYKFDNDLTDSGENGMHGTDPNGVGYETGILGSGALVLDRSRNEYIVLPTDAYPKTGVFNGLGKGTFSCWIKAATSGWIINNGNDGAKTFFGIELQASSDIRLYIRGEDYTTQMTVSLKKNIIGDGTWHMVTATWVAGGSMTIYVDGTPVNSMAMNSMTFAAWKYPMLIGSGRNASNRNLLENYFGGSLDDLKLYNYVLTNVEIAQAFLEGKPDAFVCVNEAGAMDSRYDFDGNCRIDLGDLAALASNWMACGRYPQSACAD
jgi:hypothetical protein